MFKSIKNDKIVIDFVKKVFGIKNLETRSVSVPLDITDFTLIYKGKSFFYILGICYNRGDKNDDINRRR